MQLMALKIPHHMARIISHAETDVMQSAAVAAAAERRLNDIVRLDSSGVEAFRQKRETHENVPSRREVIQSQKPGRPGPFTRSRDLQ
jgi:hypothetical protein